MGRYLQALGAFSGIGPKTFSNDQFLFSATPYEQSFLGIGTNMPTEFGEELLAAPGPKPKSGLAPSAMRASKQYQDSLTAYNAQQARLAAFNTSKNKQAGVGTGTPEEIAMAEQQYSGVLQMREARLGNQTGGVRNGVARNPFNMNMMKGPQANAPKNPRPSVQPTYIGGGGGGSPMGHGNYHLQ